MPIHPKILVHWTSPKDTNGTKIMMDRKKQSVNDYCKKFINYDKDFRELLQSILENGLRFNPIHESNWFGGTELKLPIDNLCFTELKLSDTADESNKNHCDRYGYLGIGLSRKFVMKNFGNPVFYVDRKDRLKLEASVRDLSQNTAQKSKVEKLLAQMKPMDTNDGDDYFGNYDDLEWRITLDNELKDQIVQKKVIFRRILNKKAVNFTLNLNSSLKKRLREHTISVLNI